MMEFEGYKRLVEQIMALGYDRDRAMDWAAAIGDTPELAEDGQVVVRNEDGSEAARLRLPQFRV